MSLPTRYSRIRVKDPDDVAKLYPLIVGYIENPERAETVTEFVFLGPTSNLDGYMKRDDRLPQFKTEEETRDIFNERLIADVVESLGLGESKNDEATNKDEWIRILTWMKPSLVADRKNEPGFRNWSDLGAFARGRDRKFT
jgi:hypothetical protein